MPLGVCLLVGAPGLVGCHRPEPAADRRDPAIDAIAAERVGLDEPGVRGRLLFTTYCLICHGEDGAGDGFNASNLNPSPADLRAIVAKRGETLVAQDIRGGSTSIGKSALCPPYGATLDDADRQLIVDYLREALPQPAPAQ